MAWRVHGDRFDQKLTPDVKVMDMKYYSDMTMYEGNMAVNNRNLQNGT